MVFVLACYLDDSSAESASVQTIAGYVADANAWAEFESEAEALCDLLQIDVIHGRELEAGKGCFSNWTVPRKIEFLVRLGEIIRPKLLFGISRSVIKDIYKSRKLKSDSSLSAYGFGFESISFALSQAGEFGTSAEVQENGIAYRIEAGHPNNPDLQRYVDQQVRMGKFHNSTTITFVDKKSCRAVQLADLYAFFSRRAANRYAKTKGRLIFLPDPLFHHIQRRLTHHTGLIEDPYRTATVERTGDNFEVRGWVTPI